MADEGQPKTLKSPKQQLLLLAIPGALPWLMVAVAALTDWLFAGSGGLALMRVAYIQTLIAVSASLAVLTVKDHSLLKLGVVLFNLSFPLAVVVPTLAR